jgi:Transposase, Mutator family
LGSRGSASQFNLILTDGHDDLLVAVSKLIASLGSLDEEEEQTLTFYAFPTTMHRRIQTTNAIERLWSLVPAH